MCAPDGGCCPEEHSAREPLRERSLPEDCSGVVDSGWSGLWTGDIGVDHCFPRVRQVLPEQLDEIAVQLAKGKSLKFDKRIRPERLEEWANAKEPS